MAATEFSHDNQQINDFLNKQFDTKDFLDELEEILKGFRYDAQTKQYVSIKDEGYLNEIGAKQVINVIKGVIGNVNASGKLKLDNIYEMREDIRFELLNVLGTNYSHYGLESYHLHSVLGLVDRAVWLFLSRTEDSSFFNKLSNFFKKSEVQTITQREETQDKKRRFSV